MPESISTPLLEALKIAGQNDLTAIDREIETLRGQISEIQKSIDMLAQARKLIDLKLNGKPARVPRGQSKAAKSAVSEKREADRDRIFKLLSEEGSMPCTAIGGRLGLEPRYVGVLTSHEWFVKKNGEVHIA